ncbi:hypothetical protein E2C01_052194 [Portunus trituberculatus]|uniref:Uncharacterized protein n=1 Tax=Portunus trituberculatus TaxID=210409 RepID=A0A5B7GD06_PORTR|nr:hypothetical protein [Portunus trituberculatus]
MRFHVQKKNSSSFYGSRIEEDSDEDFILSNVSQSSSSEESDESRKTEENGTDEAGGETEADRRNETETDDDSASSLAPVQGWGLVSSKQRSYAFSGKEELSSGQNRGERRKPYAAEPQEEEQHAFSKFRRAVGMKITVEDSMRNNTGGRGAEDSQSEERS